MMRFEPVSHARNVNALIIRTCVYEIKNYGNTNVAITTNFIRYVERLATPHFVILE